MSIYLKLKDVDGPVVAKGYDKHIELASFDLSGSRKVNVATSSNTKRSSSDASLSEVTLTKEWDSVSSPKLFQSLIGGALNLTASIVFTTAGTKGPVKYLVIELSDVGLTSYSMSDSSSGDEAHYPSETFHLNYSKIEFKPYTIGPDGKPEAGAVVTFNLPTREANA